MLPCVLIGFLSIASSVLAEPEKPSAQAAVKAPASLGEEQPVSTIDGEVRGDASAPAKEPFAERKVATVATATDWSVVALTLVGILGLIFLLGWAVRRMGGLRAMGVRDMKVVAALPLGTRERVAVVQVQGKRFLLGVTAQQITHLHTFDEEHASEDDSEQAFMQTLKGVLGKQHTPPTPQSTHES